MKRIIFLLASIFGMVLAPTAASAHAATTSSIVVGASDALDQATSPGEDPTPPAPPRSA